ncbi:MAG: hypothetical protein FJY66_00305 [Calditrichaeota bacterium]|nr:hypothetical protein [Calditrichota bacterium]
MSIHGSKQWMRLLICVALVVAINVMPSSAQEKTKIAGKMTVASPERPTLDVGDTPGHQLVLAQAKGTNVSTGEHKFMDGAEVVNLSFGDLAQGNGPQQGYAILSQGADTVFCKWQGEVTTTLSAEKARATSFQGAWFYTKGTGQYQNIEGRGIYKGKFVSETEYIAEWEGEYLIKK